MNRRLKKNFDLFIGKEFDTTKSGKCFIIDYKGSRDVTVMFYDGYCKKVELKELRTGKIRNPFSEGFLVFGEGICDVFTQVNGEDSKEYKLWRSMLERCYSEKYHEKKPTYKACEVCDYWKLFSNFRATVHKMSNFDKSLSEGWHLDKDILVRGNKVYSAETCCFVPSEINSLLNTNRKLRKELPLGVSYIKQDGKYAACLSTYNKSTTLSVHCTPEGAFLAYKQAKEAHIKEVAEKWKEQIDSRVYDALMNWTVEIDD